MFAAICFLLFAASLGLLMGIEEARGFIFGNLVTTLGGHVTFAAIGWVTLAICAASYLPEGDSGQRILRQNKGGDEAVDLRRLEAAQPRSPSAGCSLEVAEVSGDWSAWEQYQMASFQLPHGSTTF